MTTTPPSSGNLINGDEFANQLTGTNADDTINGKGADDIITGGLGNDIIDGGKGKDTVRFDDIDAPVTVDLAAGTATRETGFSVVVTDQPLASLTTQQSPSDLVNEAALGNLYFNLHTNDFNGGEIRGQLELQSDKHFGSVRTLTLTANLDAAQEPGPLSDSEATGTGTVVIRVEGDSVTYSSTLAITGLAVSDLLPVAGVSAIHLHNAPAGQNGPVITDIVQDAGGDIQGLIEGGGDVFAEVVETDTIINIENVTASNDADVVVGNGLANVLIGLDDNDTLSGLAGNDTLIGGAGDDVLRGGGGTDNIAGGEGFDTNDFSDINANAADPSIAGVTVTTRGNGSGTAEYIAGGVEGNPVISEQFSGIEGFIGSVNDDVFSGTVVEANATDDTFAGGRGNDTLSGGAGDDVLRGGGGTDIIDGGSGIDTNDFSDINANAADPSIAGVTVVVEADGSGTASYLAGGIAENPVINETFTGIENITGSGNDDSITANGAAPNTIDGGAGDDFIAGGGGVDVLSGGDGTDTNSFINIGAEVIADLGTGSASYAPNENVTVFENFQGFENLDGSNNDDQLFGDGGENTLTGNDGNDLLAGRGGNDTLIGGAGDDVLRGGGGSDVTDGGDGIDTADFSDIGVSVDVDLAAGTGDYVVNGNMVQDTLSNIENLTGSANDDRLSGDDGDNLIAGGAGADTLIGGAGSDILRGDAVGDGEAITVTVTNTLGEGGTFLTPAWFGFHDGANFDLFDAGQAASSGLERLAEDGSIEGIAAEFNQQIGNGGVDATILGGAGAPGPIDPGETASFTLNVNPDQVGQGFFTWATMVIPSNDAFLAAPDDALQDFIFNEDGTFAGPLVIERFGRDVLDAGTEVNTEDNAAFLNQTARDQGLTENGTVGSHIGFNGSEGNPNGGPQNVLGGTTAAGTTITAEQGDFTRNDGNEQLLRIVVDRAAGSNDVLDGGAGDDTLEGGLGRDTFVARRGTGNDTVLDFAAGTFDGDFLDVSDFGLTDLDAVLANAVQDGDNTVITLGDDADSVTLENVELGNLVAENFVFAEGGGEGPVVDPVVVVDNESGGIDVTGNDENNEIVGTINEDILQGNGGDDFINGSNGDDDIDGGQGNDTIEGSRGDDNLIGGEGDDVISGGRGDDDIFGNGGNDRLEGGRNNDNIDGGDGNDIICAGTGDDVIDGGRGNDTIEGNRGADTFVFGAESGRDTITDFNGDFDFLDLTSRDLEFESFQDVADAATQVGNNVTINLGDDNQVTLLGASVADLTEDNVLV